LPGQDFREPNKGEQLNHIDYSSAGDECREFDSKEDSEQSGSGHGSTSEKMQDVFIFEY